MKSMTGFGRGIAGKNSNRVVVTIKTYNSRFLDIKIRGCENDTELESKVRDFLQQKVIRGSVFVSIEADRSDKDSVAISFNRERFEAIEKILISIQKDYGRHLDISDLVSADDIISERGDNTFTVESIDKALQDAFLQMNEMRINEGNRLKEDFKNRLNSALEISERFSTLNDDTTNERNDRMKKRIQELLGNLDLDETRLAQEIAILAERSDVTEEITRFNSHIEQFTGLLDSDEPIGKRCNFILQEMGREINTIGSKSANPELTTLVIHAKDELEKMREQVQNIL